MEHREGLVCSCCVGWGNLHCSQNDAGAPERSRGASWGHGSVIAQGICFASGSLLARSLCPNILAAFSQLVKIIKSEPELFILLSFTTVISTWQKNKSKTAGSSVKSCECGVYSAHPMLWLPANLKVVLTQPRILMQRSPKQRRWKTLREIGFCNLNYSMITLNCLLSRITSFWEAVVLPCVWSMKLKINYFFWAGVIFRFNTAKGSVLKKFPLFE